MKSSGTFLRFLFALVLTIAAVITPLTGAGAAAQGAQTFQSPLTGMTIQATGPWSIETDSVYSQDGIESVTVMGQYEFMQIWFMPGNLDLVEARDVILDSFALEFGSFVTIDRGAYGNVSYSLDMTSSEGIEFGVFSLFLGQRESGFVEYYVYFGAVPVFATGFASAQQNVTVGGRAVFDGVQGGGLQDFLVQNQGATGATSQTQTAPPAPQQDPVPTEVSAPATEVPAPTTEVPAQQTSSADGAAYITAVEGEISYVTGGAIDFVMYLSQMSGEDGETAIAQIDTLAKEWAAYQDRAALIVAPPGYEAVDAEYRKLATEVSEIGAMWDDIIAAAQNSDPAFTTLYDEFVTRISGILTFTVAVSTAIEAQQGTAQTQTNPDPAPTAATTVAPTEPAGQTSTGSSEGDTYIATIAQESADIERSLGTFNEGIQLLGSDDPAESELGAQQVSDTLNYWGTYSDVADKITAPAGYEEIDAAYREVADLMPAMASGFVSYLEAEDPAVQETALADFVSLVDDVETGLTNLNTLIDAAGSSAPVETGTGNQTDVVPTEEPIEEPTEEPIVEPTEESQGNSSETGGRGQLPPDPGEDDDDEPSGTTRTSQDDFEELGLVADDEYVSPQFDIDVIWDDRWEFDPEGAEDPIFSDTEQGYDSLTLMWTGGADGDITVLIGDQTGFTPEENVDYWQTDEYFEQLGVDGEVLLAEAGTDRGAVLLMLDAGDDGVVLYREAVCLDRSCEQWAIVTVFAPVADAVEMIADAEEGIEVGGDSATDVFSQREIRRALGE